MSCPYYWYNYHYACRKSGKDVNEDTYDKYCKNYDYEDCPIYKGNDTSGCFLTSACVNAKGLPDDCYELTTLRKFRDEYLSKQECGECEIAHYYHVAPAIVERINASKNSTAVFTRNSIATVDISISPLYFPLTCNAPFILFFVY